MKRLLAIAVATATVSFPQGPAVAEGAGFFPNDFIGPHSPAEMAAVLERFLVSGGGVLYPDGVESPVANGGAAIVDGGWPTSLASRIGQRVFLSVSRETGLYEFRDASGTVFHAESPHSPLVWNWIAAFRDPDGADPENASLHAPWRVSMSWFLAQPPNAASGGDRTSGAGGRFSGDIAPVPQRSAPDPSAPVSNLCFTAFSYTSSNIAFTVSWPEDDPPPDGVLDLYCSTNILQRFPWRVHTECGATNPPHVFSVEPSVVPGWNLPAFHVHGPGCQATTNIVVSPLDGTTVYTNVTYGCTPPPPFNPAGFFRLGTRHDTDGDGMPDAWERLVSLSDPEDAADALFDPDADGLPNVYEWHAGTDPCVPDWDAAPKTRVGGTNAVSSLFCALAASEPYDILEIAPGAYSGPDWCNIFMPDHPVMVTTGDGGRARDVAIMSGGTASTAAFWSGDDQTGHTSFQGLTIALGGREDSTQMGFYVGGSPPIPGLGQGHGSFFRNVTVLLGRNPSMNTGWYLMHHGGPKVVLAGCVVDGTGSVSARGVHSIDGPDIELENCTFRAFPSDPAKAHYGIHLHGMGQTGEQASVTLSGCLFDSSFSNAWPIARSGVLSRHGVLMAGCALPVEFDDPVLVPDVSVSNLVISVDTYFGGHLSTNAPAPETPFSPLWHVMDIDGEPVGFPCAAGADEPGIPDPGRDTDGDGLTDGDEIFALSTSPLVRDTDGDGLSDAEESVEGTDPINPGSLCFTLSGTASTPAGFSFSPSLSILCDSATGTNATLATVPVLATNGWFSFPHLTLSDAPGQLRLCLFLDRNGDGMPEEDESRAFAHFAPTGHVNTANVQFANIIDDVDGDGIPDLWEVSRSLNYTNALDAWEDPDADGLVNLHEYWHDYDPFIPDGSNTVLSVLARSVDDRLVGKNPATALPFFSNYPAISSGSTTNALVPNPDCWAAEIDFSCESPWNSIGKHRKSGTLISSRHILLAKHHNVAPNPLGAYFYFRSTNGIVYRRTLVSTNAIALTPDTDLLLGKLDEPLPASVSVAKILPENFTDYVHSGRGVPVASLDQEGKILVSEVSELETPEIPQSSSRTVLQRPKIERRTAFFESLVEGDSSNPAFFLFGEQPILLGIHWTATHSGASVRRYAEALETAMDELSPGETNHVETVSFEGFPKLPQLHED